MDETVVFQSFRFDVFFLNLSHLLIANRKKIKPSFFLTHNLIKVNSNDNFIEKIVRFLCGDSFSIDICLKRDTFLQV